MTWDLRAALLSPLPAGAPEGLRKKDRERSDKTFKNPEEGEAKTETN
jgi:hypothetical protein